MRLDFPTIMVLLVLVTGLIWAVDAAVLSRRRRVTMPPGGEDAGGTRVEVPPPRVVEYARSFFPVFLIVLVLRSFLVEPFRIPSGSMMPTLLVGDFILVNKFTYGIRLPVVDRKVVELGDPERGDVIVFRYPEDPATPFIKRVVGVPGDHVAYYNKMLYINGEPVRTEELGSYVGRGSGRGMSGASRLRERLDSSAHEILLQPGYHSVEVRTVVPEGHYFMLGDNRDNSRDSRYWGFVPDEYLIGKAFTIWLNWDWGHGIDWSRIGRSID